MRAKLLLVALSWAVVDAASNGYTIRHATRWNTPDTGRVIRIEFSDPIDPQVAANFSPSNIKLVAQTSATDLGPQQAHITANSGNFAIDVPYATDPAADDAEIDVSIGPIAFADKHTEAKLTGTVQLNVSKIAAEKQAALADLQKVPQSTSEKNIFASGFVTTASGGTAGGADMILNSLDLGIPNLTSFLQIKKSSVSGGDPKNFEAGTKYHYAWVHDANKFDQIRQKLTQYRASGDETLLKDVQDLENQIQKRTLAATLLDFSAKFEGEATQFNVSNAVGDGSLQLQTMTRKIGDSHGFWKARFIPAGFEGGRNLNTAGQNQTPTTTLNGQQLPAISWVSRFKAGTEVTVFYDNPNSLAPMKRVELTAGIVERYLFFKEAGYDSTTKTIQTTNTGSHPWAQVDLKFIVGETTSARYGFKLTYERWSLPPVFADTKTFQFGFLYESVSSSKQ